MKNIRWKVYEEGRFLKGGVVTAESDRGAMEDMMRELATSGADPDKCYRVEVGELVASSYGDEFVRTAEAGTIDETDVDPSGYLHPAPRLDIFTGDLSHDHPWNKPNARPLGDIERAAEKMMPASTNPILEEIRLRRDAVNRSIRGNWSAQEAMDIVKEETGRDVWFPSGVDGKWSTAHVQSVVDELRCRAKARGNSHDWENIPGTISGYAPLGSETCGTCHKTREKRDRSLPGFDHGPPDPNTDDHTIETCKNKFDDPKCQYDKYKDVSIGSSNMDEAVQEAIEQDQSLRDFLDTVPVDTGEARRQWQTVTGRISCAEPNLQNHPIHSEQGRKIREAITGDIDLSTGKAKNMRVGRSFPQPAESYVQIQCMKCNTLFPVDMPVSGWPLEGLSGIPCAHPQCDATFTLEVS
jgi:hypothetical protein